MKNLLIFLVVISSYFSPNLSAGEKLPTQLIKYKYDLNIPNELNLNISGKNYIKYLKQIKLTGQKENLNSRVINSTKKKWVNSEIRINQNIVRPKIILAIAKTRLGEGEEAIKILKENTSTTNPGTLMIKNLNNISRLLIFSVQKEI